MNIKLLPSATSTGDDFVSSKIFDILELFDNAERKMPRMTAAMEKEIAELFESSDFGPRDYVDGLRAAEVAASELADIFTKISSRASGLVDEIEDLK